MIRNQRGAIMVMIAALVVGGGILCFCILAIDGPIMMTTKTQLQNAADGGALAAALVWDPENDATKSDAIDAARAITLANLAVQDTMRPVDIEDGDVEFDDDDGIVRVHTHRTADHNNPLRTYFLKLPFLTNTNLVDVQAVAAAQQYAVCGVQCLKPWAIPDRWSDDNGDDMWTDGEPYTDTNGNDAYDYGEPYTDSNLNGVRDSGEFYDPLITGYLAPGDVGTQIDLHADTRPGPIVSGHYYAIDLPPLGYPGQDPLTGGDWYREWIATCAPYYVSPGDTVLLEPGLMVGPTMQGVRDLIAADPDAYWDPTTRTVQSPEGGKSPRIALVPFFDPQIPPKSGRNNVVITKIGAFFIESVTGSGEITGRFIKVGAPGEPCDDPNAPGAFVTSVHLVE